MTFGGSGGGAGGRIEFRLGKSSKGDTVGGLGLRFSEPSSDLASPKRLHQLFLTHEVQIATDSNGFSQVLAPQAAVDVNVINAFKYELQFYERDDVIPSSSTGTVFQVVTGAQPWVTWSVENPDASTSTYNRLRFTKSAGSVSNTFEYDWDDQDEEWTLDADGLRDETFQSVWDTNEVFRTDTHAFKNPAGTAARETEYTYQNFDWGVELIKQIEDPDGDALTTTKTYYDQHAYTVGVIWNPYADRHARLASEINADGSWKKIDYDELGRKAVEQEAWKDSGTNSAPSESMATYYSYEIHDPNEFPSIRDKRPRTIEKKVQDLTIEKTFYAYYADANTNIVEIEERAVSPTASYGDSDNLRTVTIKHGAGAVVPREPKSIEFPDGRFDSYTYEQGHYVAGGTIPGTFTAGTGDHVRVTLTHGMTNSSDGVAYKTTREVMIWDSVRNELLRETFVYDGTGYESVDWTVQEFDDLGNLTETYFANGTSRSKSWSTACCGLDSEVDIDGSTIFYSYDSLGRLTEKTRDGVAATSEYPAQEDIVTTYTHDGFSNVLTVTVSAGGLSLITSNEYDVAGRLVKTVDPAGLVTTYDYTEGGRITTVTRPGGATEITENYLDGRVKSVTGTALVHRHYEYGVNTDGSQWIKTYTGPDGTNSVIWEKTTVDMLGRTIQTETPAFGGGGLTNTFVYNDEGQLVRATQPLLPDTLYTYDVLGNQIREGLDVNANGVLDLASLDRINETETSFVKISGDWWQESVSKVYAVENSATATTFQTQRKKLTGSNCGCEAGESESVDIHGNITKSTVSIVASNRLVTRTTTLPNSTNDIVSVVLNGLLMQETSMTGIKTTYAYDALGRRTEVREPRAGTSWTHYNADGRVDYIEDPASNRTTFAYDSATGRRAEVTDALTNKTYMFYNIRGQITNTTGATYPVANAYDSFGRMTQLKTWRNESSSPDITTWHYDDATGLLTNKRDAAGQGVTYTYTSEGRLAARTWARSITTDYAYDALGQLTNVNYSDSTPDLSFNYDRLGRQTGVSDGSVVRTFAYNTNLQLETETIAQVGGFETNSLTRTYDDLGRPSGITLGANHTVAYGYDTAGRFSTISSSVESASSAVVYSYLSNSDLIAGCSNNSGFAMARTYEANRDLISSIVNRHNGTLIRRFDYENDATGRRIQRADTDITDVITNLFRYNSRSELISAAIGTNDYSYSYDAIGNRESDIVNAITNLYTANEVHQYTNITGVAAPTYDADGNMLTYGTWTFTWNAENRLIMASNGTTVVENSYDYLGRRVRKATNGETNTFLYDGWNMIQETQVSGITSQVFYVWGLDLSGSIQGAGGIGGLLSRIEGSGSNSQFYTYDANGNVANLIETNGMVVATYDYDAYGNLLKAEGVESDSNPYRFSTKYYDTETTLSYYGYRFYNSRLGRWIGRDPIQEQGGFNLYLFTSNDPIGLYDILGLVCNDECPYVGERRNYRQLGYVISPISPSSQLALNLAIRYGQIALSIPNGLSPSALARWLVQQGFPTGPLLTAYVNAILGRLPLSIYMRFAVDECRETRCLLFCKRNKWVTLEGTHRCTLGGNLGNGDWTDYRRAHRATNTRLLSQCHYQALGEVLGGGGSITNP